MSCTRVTTARTAPTASAVAAFHSNGGGAAFVPSQPKLLGNWPNPATAGTRIAFLLPATVEGKVSLGVYDANGRRVRELHGGFSPGRNDVVWDSADESGTPVRSGVYFYRLDVAGLRYSRRMAVVR